MLAETKEEALKKVVSLGAIASTVESYPDEVPLAYMNGAIRCIVKAVGNLDIKNLKADEGIKQLEVGQLITEDDEPY